MPTSRAENNNITVADLSGLDRPIPNPVRTFEEAFKHYRKFTVNICGTCMYSGSA